MIVVDLELSRFVFKKVPVICVSVSSILYP